MYVIVATSFKGFFRDRVFYAILAIALLFLFVPSVSSLSMRQVASLSITLSSSLTSFILLLLSVFLGGTSLWRDLERRYSYGILGLPIRRSQYVLGKFLGVSLFLLLTALLLSVVACCAVYVTATLYPPLKPLMWFNIYVLFVFEAFKYVLLVACAFLFASVSTSFFLPIFGTIAVFITGSVTQQIYDYVHSPAGQAVSGLVRNIASCIYYILPNFSAFDLKANAIYSISLHPQGLLLTVGYFVVYTSIILYFTNLAFNRRELM
jgi:ABC-type transport system involved in multi-copper enzyme maturation permease subunit